MARFIRDEKRTYPFTWLVVGGIFAGSAAWAVYAELVTRVPWEKEQEAFFEMELQQSKQALERANNQWKETEKGLQAKINRKADLEKSQQSGEYAAAKARLDQLNVDFGNAELDKTFGGSDLDEAYYYRQEAEYERDKVATEIRALIREHWAGVDLKRGEAEGDKIYADPPLSPKKPEWSEKMYHLQSEIERMEAHIRAITAYAPQVSTEIERSYKAGEATAWERLKKVEKLLVESKKLEQDVAEKIKVEIKNQERVDKALAAMSKIDGPPEPPLSEKDPVKRADERKRERAKACQGHEDTRTCINWFKLEPVDLEVKALDVELSKGRRGLIDAELRFSKADAKARPKFDPADVIHSIVGPFQIQQVVLNWMDFDRDVDREQVDRCQTCHMGSAAGNYTSAAISRQFRSHPWRSTLMNTHPIEKFGCTSCHQGEGRATDNLAHSGWHLEEKEGQERWHFAGDHYWEDPLLPIGMMTKIIVDEENDELAVKLNKGKWETIKLDHRSPEAHAHDENVPTDYHGDPANKISDEAAFFGSIQTKLQKLVAADTAVASKWHAVVRKLDNRVQIGLEQNDAAEIIGQKDQPNFYVKFPKSELAVTLGFPGVSETSARVPLLVGNAPPEAPIRGEGEARLDDKGRYHPPRGAEGLQIPDEMRNRFIESLPEMEASCLRCHQSDVDLKPRYSKAKYVAAKLEREKAEAWLAKDRDGYKKAHDGSEELPAILPDPTEAQDPVPTFTEGRHLFRKLNCTGCHILDGYAWDRNAGPSLDNVTAKVTPEFILTWIRNPRGWRAKTRMPNLWPKPLDPASKRPIPPESPEYEKWKSTMREETVAIASFLVEHSDKPSTRPGAAKDAQPLKNNVQGYSDVPGATAEKGKTYFESYGCQGCHATSDSDLAEPWKSRERDIAPTLANMGAKTTADWIAYWVENPARYWHGTKMPNLRLNRLEAASIAKYVSSLKSAALDPAEVAAEDVKLVTEKRNEKVACANAGGQLMTRVECGERLIGYYGCFGCHNISGFEKNAPIAPELGGFAKKDITTLDFGYAIPDHHLQTTETFASLKLDSPRIYRRDRIELKMADFDLSPREIRALVTFLKGLTSGKPRNAYAPSEHADYKAALDGRQIIDDYNCRACHVIEEHGADIDAVRGGQLAADVQARAPYLNGEGMRVQPEWLFSFLRDPGKHGIRPWLHPEWAYPEGVPEDKLTLRMPTFNFNEEQVTAIVRYFASWDGQEYPYEAVKANDLDEKSKTYVLTHMMSTEAANCLSCHYQGEFPVQRGKDELGKMAPNLNNVARRLRPEWVKAWLLRPQNWLPYTKMTAFWATSDRPKDILWGTEQDPFISKVPEWKQAPGPENVTSDQQAEMVRDFLFSLPPDAVFPTKIDEVADSPLVKKQAPALKAEAEPTDKDKKGGKDKDKKGKDEKGKNKNPRRTGAISGPARF